MEHRDCLKEDRRVMKHILTGQNCLKLTLIWTFVSTGFPPFSAGSKRHVFSAAIAAASKSFPSDLTTSTLCTRPSTPTVHHVSTAPLMPRAFEGYFASGVKIGRGGLTRAGGGCPFAFATI